MTDGQAIALAIACLLGALGSGFVPILPVALLSAAVAAAVLARRPPLLVAAALLLCASRADAGWRSINAPMPDQIAGIATLRSDPVRSDGATTVLLRIGGRNALATAWGPAGARLASAVAGDRANIVGHARPWTASTQRRASLHTSHRILVDTVTVEPTTAMLWRIANALRGQISRGAAGLDPERRALFTGLVFGDDRGQSPLTEADFRIAGLTHLLAVSGQNVAYLLVLLRPLLARLRLPSRWLVTLAALLVFATATRFEPSVLRATTMAAIAATGGLLGRETSSLRMLALAVSVLVVHDPLLASSVGFQLSVAATCGIVVLGHRIARRLGGGPVAAALAVTLSAQLAVAPLLVHTFGPLSVASVPANLLAGPVAGLVMAWGMTAGFAAGSLGGAAAGAVHTVTNVALWWLETVARAAATVPLAPVGLIWIAAAVSVALVLSRRDIPRVGTLAALLVCALLVSLLRPQAQSGVHPVGPGSTLEVGRTTVILVLEGRADAVWIIEDLRRLGVVGIDLAVIDAERDRSDLDAISARIAVSRVLSVDRESPDAAPSEYRVGDVDVTIGHDQNGLEVTVQPGVGQW